MVIVRIFVNRSQKLNKMTKLLTQRKKTLMLVVCALGLCPYIYLTCNDKIFFRKNFKVSENENERDLATVRIYGNMFKSQSEGLNCMGILQGNRTAIDMADKIVLASSAYLQNINETDFNSMVLNMTKDCNVYKKALYSSFKVHDDEISFPIAYALKIHRSILQFEKLFRHIYSPQNIYCIYIDLNSPESFHKAVQSIVRCFDNVFIASELEHVVYASISHVRSDLQCMKELVNSSVDWKYYLNVVGQEYPLKTNREIIHILKHLNGRSSIETYPHTNRRRFAKKEPFHLQWELHKGSAYGIFARSFVNYILTDKEARDFINWASDIYSPEETVWATLIRHHSLNISVRHDKHQQLSRAVIWKWDHPVCHGEYVRSVCIYGIGDFPWLASQPNIFANKIDVFSDSAILECLDEWLKLKNEHANPALTLNWHYLNNLPQMAGSNPL